MATATNEDDGVVGWHDDGYPDWFLVGPLSYGTPQAVRQRYERLLRGRELRDGAEGLTALARQYRHEAAQLAYQVTNDPEWVIGVNSVARAYGISEQGLSKQLAALATEEGEGGGDAGLRLAGADDETDAG